MIAFDLWLHQCKKCTFLSCLCVAYIDEILWIWEFCFTILCLCSAAVTWTDKRAQNNKNQMCLYIWLELNSNCGVVNKIGKNSIITFEPIFSLLFFVQYAQSRINIFPFNVNVCARSQCTLFLAASLVQQQ